MAVSKLVRATFTYRKARVALRILAIALAVSLVVAVTSGYSSAEAAIFRYLAEFLGATDIEVMRQGDTGAAISDAIVSDLKKDPAVKSVVGRLEARAKILDAEGKQIAGEWQIATLI